MKSVITKNNEFNSMFSVLLLFVFCSFAHAQNSAPVQADSKKYVRMDIGHGAMHCPFLIPKLEAQLKNIKGVENFFMDKENSYATFNLPADTEMTLESLKKIGTDVGYPADDVFVKVDTKPIEAINKQ